MSKGREYELLMLDAEKLIHDYDIVKDKNSKNRIRYKVDFTKKEFAGRFVENTDFYDDTALFHQMLCQLDKESDRVKALISDKNEALRLKRLLIFVDFGNLFLSLSENKNREIIDKNEYTVNELRPNSRAISNEYRLYQMFEHGIDIKFSDEDAAILGDILGKTSDGYMTFIPFDKSGSMSRESKMSFVNNTIPGYLSNLNKRLLLDIDFSIDKRDEKKSIIGANEISRFYAYKGLYLSSARRINSCYEILDRKDMESLVLNEETVIILKDKYEARKGSGEVNNNLLVEYITAEKDGETNKIKMESQENGIKPRELEIGSIFDGEGIISKEYKERINDMLGLKRRGDNPKEATSFQIRMPFAKGMLHTVDFLGFLRDEFGITDSYMIKDYFGIERDLKKARIILSNSMFKAAKWFVKLRMVRSNRDLRDNNYRLRDLIFEEYGNDPMRYYFKKLADYEHSLYISNTNVPYIGKTLTTLNYQFLNTVGLSERELSGIVNSHLKYVRNPERSIAGLADTDDETTSLEKWQRLLSVNSEVRFEKSIKRKLEAKSNSLLKDLAKGRIILPGEVRYLSRDLLSYMLSMFGLFDREEYRKRAKELSKEALEKSEFYMPKTGAKELLKRENYYALFRNPHLSRNEECALKPRLPELLEKDASREDIYEKYFGSLKGILMVSRTSFAPNALGGADFDGDIVKLYYSQTINDAVRREIYKKGTKRQERKVPIVSIPSISGTLSSISLDVDKIHYTTIRETFANNIGRISNLAIKIGQRLYSADCREESINGHTCAECTVLTGLDIDAAKSGFRPDLSEMLKEVSDYFKEADRKSFDYVTQFEKKVDNLPVYRARLMADYDETKEFKCRRKDFSFTYKKDEKAGTLNLLTHFFLSEYTNNIKNDSEGKKFRFRAVQDEGWDEIIKREDIAPFYKEIEALIMAYGDVIRIMRNSSIMLRESAENNMLGRILTTFKTQYSRYLEKIDEEPGEKSRAVSYEEVESVLYAELLDTLALCFLKDEEEGGVDVAKIDAAIKRLENSEWPYLINDNEKKSTLYELLQIKEDKIELLEEAECMSLIYNFSNKGYFLLYYILHELFVRYNDMVKSSRMSGAEFRNNIKSAKRIRGSRLYEESLRRLSDIYYEALTEIKTNSVIQAELLGCVREELARIKADILFEVEDFDKEDDWFRIIYKAKKENDQFIWDYFSFEELKGQAAF